MHQQIVSRRAFVAGATASTLVAGSALIGSTAHADVAPLPEEAQSEAAQQADTIYAAAENPAEASETREADIVIVGSGIAGMSAAAEASMAGAKVIILEKRDITGGDSSICTGNFYCCGSKKQDELGYTNYGTADEIAQFYLDQSDGDANPECVRHQQTGSSGHVSSVIVSQFVPSPHESANGCSAYARATSRAKSCARGLS